jgi:hypothetical protein
MTGTIANIRRGSTTTAKFRINAAQIRFNSRPNNPNNFARPVVFSRG